MTGNKVVLMYHKIAILHSLDVYFFLYCVTLNLNIKIKCPSLNYKRRKLFIKLIVSRIVIMDFDQVTFNTINHLIAVVI